MLWPTCCWSEAPDATALDNIVRQEPGDNLPLPVVRYLDPMDAKEHMKAQNAVSPAPVPPASVRTEASRSSNKGKTDESNPSSAIRSLAAASKDKPTSVDGPFSNQSRKDEQEEDADKAGKTVTDSQEASDTPASFAARRNSVEKQMGLHEVTRAATGKSVKYRREPRASNLPETNSLLHLGMMIRITSMSNINRLQMQRKPSDNQVVSAIRKSHPSGTRSAGDGNETNAKRDEAINRIRAKSMRHLNPQLNSLSESVDADSNGRMSGNLAQKHAPEESTARPKGLASLPETTAAAVSEEGLYDDIQVLGRHVLIETFESEQQMMQRCIIHPSGIFRRYWAVMMLILILTTAIEVPLVIGFAVNDNSWITAFEAVIDVLFAVDMIVSFRTGYLSDDHDAVVAVPWMIGRKYVGSDLLIDVVSTAPIDRIVNLSIGGGVEYRSLRLLRTVRLIRLLRLLKLFRFFRWRRFQSSIRMELSIPPALVRIGALMFNVFMIAHFIACGLFYSSHASSKAGEFVVENGALAPIPADNGDFA